MRCSLQSGFCHVLNVSCFCSYCHCFPRSLPHFSPWFLQFCLSSLPCFYIISNTFSTLLLSNISNVQINCDPLCKIFQRLSIPWWLKAQLIRMAYQCLPGLFPPLLKPDLPLPLLQYSNQAEQCSVSKPLCLCLCGSLYLQCHSSMSC